MDRQYNQDLYLTSFILDFMLSHHSAGSPAPGSDVSALAAENMGETSRAPHGAVSRLFVLLSEEPHLRAKPHAPSCLPWADGKTHGACRCPGCGTARVLDAVFHDGWNITAGQLGLISPRFSQALALNVNRATHQHRKTFT